MAQANGNGINWGAGVIDSRHTHVTECANSNNPAGHNPDCPCKKIAVRVDVEKFRAWKAARYGVPVSRV